LSSERGTHDIFDLTIKYLLQETSSFNAVNLINTLFERDYLLDSQVRFEKTDSVQKQKGGLKSYRSDMILNLAGDDFALEFQTRNDRIIGLRIFEYGFRHAYRNKKIYESGELIVLDIPEGCVIYWESSGSTPDKITLRLQGKTQENTFDYEVRVFKMSEQSLEMLEEKHLLILLPFCLLKFRKDLEREGISEAERKAIAELEKQFVEDLEAVLSRAVKSGCIDDTDRIIILESIYQMHDELYGQIEEFQEVNMILDERIKLRWKDHERELKLQWKARENKILDLLKQGHTLEEVEKILLEEDKSE